MARIMFRGQVGRLEYHGSTTRAAMVSPAVRAALKAKAEALRVRADALGAQEGVEMESRVESGTRPKGRPFSNVVSENVGQEYGDMYTERRRILGRVAEEG